jgi:hypothetical protein
MVKNITKSLWQQKCGFTPDNNHSMENSVNHDNEVEAKLSYSIPINATTSTLEKEDEGVNTDQFETDDHSNIDLHTEESNSIKNSTSPVKQRSNLLSSPTTPVATTTRSGRQVRKPSYLEDYVSY